MKPLDHERLLYSAPVALVVTDESGDIKFLNSQGSALLGASAGQGTPLNFCSFFDKRLIDHDQRTPDLSVKVLADIHDSHPDQWLIHGDGTKTYVHLALESYTEGPHSFYVWTLTPLDSRNLAYDIKERVKEQVAVVKVVEAFFESKDLPTSLNRSLLAIQSGWQFPYATSVRVQLDSGEAYETDDFQRTRWLLSEDIITSKRRIGVIEVCYTVEIPAHDGVVFLKEEVRLIRLLAKVLGILIDQRQSAEIIRANAHLLRKITRQVPANTYQFEILPDGGTRILFMSKGTETYNHPYEAVELEQEPDKLFEVILDTDKAKFHAAMQEAVQTGAFLSVQYRVLVDNTVRWRWLKAVPENKPDGNTIWYGASQDITLLVEYISSVEQILYDISHIIRSPLASILGISKFIRETKMRTEEMRDITKNLLSISEELDFYIQQLNDSYEQKRKLDRDYHVDFSPAVDHRDDFFGRKS